MGFYTKDTPYKEEAEQLVESCHKFNIPIEVKAYENRGTWVRNAGIKPEFLKEMLQKYERIVYLDADARIRKYPELFNTLDVSIGVHYRDDRELLSGTIFLTRSALPLIDEWVAQQQLTPNVWDQKVLDRVLQNGNYSIARLPGTYCQIFDTMRKLGQPVIEHLQASRRFRQIVTIARHVKIPESYLGVRIRRAENGSYWIARHHRDVEKFLDANCIRLQNSLKWEPKFLPSSPLENLEKYFKGRPCYIVGKGPSLDFLTEKYFHYGDAPIIALNEAIHKVEKLDLTNPTFGLQQDACLGNTCLPKKSPLFVEMKAGNFYADFNKAYFFQNTDFKLNRNALSVSAAIKIAQKLGSRSFELLCFDACVLGDTGYAKCVGYDPKFGGEPKRFLSHRAKILKHTQHVVWVIPRRET